MNIEEYSKYKQPRIKETPKLLLKYLSKAGWKSFLDLGCGDGQLLDALNREKYLDEKNVYAADLSESRVNLVKKINKKFVCFVADASNVKEIENNSIDFLVCSQLIEHVQNQEELVKEIKRMMSPGAVLYLSTIFKKWYGWYFYRCRGKWTIDPTHLREYKKDSQLLDILIGNGFEVLENKKTIECRSIFNFKIPVLGYYVWEIVCKKK